MLKSRRIFLKKTGAFTASLALAGLTNPLKAQNLTKPNIVLIMADDLGYECLSCYGSKSYKTPHLDKLAAEGVKFDNCFAQPLCTPSRVKIMTGKYNIRNYTKFGELHKSQQTFANHLKKAGYKTCVAGKWQLYNDKTGSNPADKGFDEHCLWAYKTRGNRYPDPTFTINDEIVKEMKGKYGPDVCADFIMDFMEKNKDKPFLAYYPMILTHAPIRPTPDRDDWKNNKYGNNKKYFPDMVRYMDKIVKRITDKLDYLGIRENTLILFTGDNGTPRPVTTQAEFGTIPGGKGQTHEYGIHVPLIASWKGHDAKGYVCDDLIDFSDFLPTLLDTANVTLPRNQYTDGNSFLPQMKGHKGNSRDYVFCDFYPNMGKPKTPATFVRSKHFKLYKNGEFFNVKNDPCEKHPLNDDQLNEKQKKTKQHLKQKLTAIVNSPKNIKKQPVAIKDKFK